MPLIIQAHVTEEAFTRRAGLYVKQFIEHIERADGPDDLGIRQLCEELSGNPEMFTAVWAHLRGWHRNIVRNVSAIRID